MSEAITVALDADPVAEVEVGEVVQAVAADLAAGDDQLDLAGLVLEVGEVEAAVAALTHHPAGDVDQLAGVGPRRELTELGADRGGGRVAVEADRVGLDATRAQRLELRQAVGARLLLELACASVLGVGLWSRPGWPSWGTVAASGGRDLRFLFRQVLGLRLNCDCCRASTAIPTPAATSASSDDGDVERRRRSASRRAG